MKKSKHLFLSFTALLLAMLTLLLLPVQVAAQVVTPVPGESDCVQTATFDEASCEGNIIGEDITKRDEYTKHFVTDAGTVIAAQYAFPVHFKNAEGEYVDYDNRLIESEVETSAATADEATSDEVSVFSLRAPTETPKVDEVLTNKKSNSKVAHFKKSGKAKLVEITRDGHTISWGYSGANIVDAQKVESASEELTGNDAFLSLPNLSSTLVYEDIYNNIDLEVINSTAGVKENIILKAENAKNVFNIEYSIGDLTAESKDAHTVVLKDAKGQEKYTITAPFMQDANGAESEALELKILKNNKGKLSLKLTADKKWLKDSSRTYPVTIDPSFIYGQDLGDSVYCAYMNSASEDTRFDSEGTVYVGMPDDDNGVRRSVIRFGSLPELNTGDMVVGAEFAMNQVTADATVNMYVGVYEVTETFTKNKIRWSNQLSCSDVLIDYEKIPKNTKAWRTWDITELVKKWYNGSTNNGFYLKMLYEDSTYQGLGFTSTLYPTASDYRPALVVTYRNNKGLEPYWDYTTVSAGTAGVAYVNNYSGNLVFQTSVASTASPSYPANLVYTYNSYMAGTDYELYDSYAGKGWKMNYQASLLDSVNFGLEEETQLKYPYVYTDGDGTDHYFYKKTVDGVDKYVDEDGLNLTIEGVDSNLRSVVDKDNNSVLFDSQKGRIVQMKNSSNSNISVSYESSTSNFTTAITDEDGNVINISKSNGMISKITDPANRATTMGYSGDYLTSVTSPDGTVTFAYTNGLLTTISNPDGTGLIFTYATHGSKGVTSVQEFATEVDNATGSKTQVLGQKITFDRSKYNTTTIRTAGKDGIHGNSNDILNIHQFDNWGRTVSVNSQLKSGSNLSAGAATYTSGQVNSDASNIGYLNRVSSSFSMGANRENIVIDHGFEGDFDDDDIWASSKWGTGTVDFSAGTTDDPENVLFGHKSLQITVNSVSGNSRGRVYQNIDGEYLTQGTTYTVSAYVKTVDVQPMEGATSYGAVLAITPRDSDSSTPDMYAEHVSINTTDENVNKGFRRVSLTFTMPPSDTFNGVRIQLALRGARGTVYFDGVQLEKSSNAPSPYNFLENASFERTVDYDLPEHWNSVNIPNRGETTSFESTTHRHEKKSVILYGAVKNKRNIFQEVPVNGSEADTYILSGWAKAPSVPNETNSSCFELRVKIYYDDGTDTTKRAAKFNTTIDDWQFTTFAFNLDDGNKDKNSTPTRIGVYLIYYYQGNNVLFDNIQLTKEPVPSYTYDEDGNLISVVANAEQNAEYEYADNKLTEYTDPNGGTYEYTYYDGTKRLKTAKNQSGATYTFTYDDAGRATSMVGTAEGEASIKTEMSYTAPEEDPTAYVESISDQDGRTIENTYNSKTGTLQSIKDVNGEVTTYTYDEDTDRIESITHDDQSVSYNYDDFGKLTGISHEGTDYEFAYDKFGLRTTTKVGSRTLSTNTYNSNHSLASVAYGNGHTVSYTYDNFGNASTVSYNNVTAVKNYSDASGNIIRTEDLLTNLEHRVSYDSTGRLISKDVLDLTKTRTNDKWLRTVEYDFDENNNMTKLAFASKNGSNVTKYTYGDDNLPSKTTLYYVNDENYGNKVTYDYDVYGRLTRKELDTSNHLIYTYEYMDSERDGDYTTTKIRTEFIGSNKYRYTYDAYGNIKRIYSVTSEDDPGTLLHLYMYDSANQLTADMDAELDRIIDYSYDEAGNILQKKISAWDGNVSTVVRGNVISTDTYSYTDSTWKDLLTSYNGQTITYDEVGNPLSYRDGITLTWQNGRELANFSNNNYDITYSYDADGMRTTKSIDVLGDIKYVYEGGLLLQMDYLGKIFDFSYDANGTPIGFRYNDDGAISYYYYGVNSRGDIVSIFDSEGKKIIGYSYDAYGKPISIVCTSDDSFIANTNPLRYRGYVYDKETGFYYLQSRYYDPETCRFVNEDIYCDTGIGLMGLNMFAYCNNNPVMYIDVHGTLLAKDSGPCRVYSEADYYAYLIETQTTIKKEGDEIIADVPIKDNPYISYLDDAQVAREYSKSLHNTIENEASNYDEPLQVMTEKHIYSELLAHYYVYIGFESFPIFKNYSGLETLYISSTTATLNPSEDRKPVLWLMDIIGTSY